MKKVKRYIRAITIEEHAQKAIDEMKDQGPGNQGLGYPPAYYLIP